MPTQLNTLPVRVPIGVLTDDKGVERSVLMTPEFARMLSDLLTRTGGSFAFSNEEIAAMFAGEAGEFAAVGALRSQVAELAQLVMTLRTENARLTALESKFADMAHLLNSFGPAPVDWEHPGKVGAATPNTGKFTTFEVTGKVNVHPANLAVDIKPTGTSMLTILPQAAGQIDNMELGKTTPAPARVTTLNKITFTQPATGATITMNDGATLTVAGAGGTLGSAAYTSGTAYAGRTAAALGPAATDAATNLTLSNNMRSALLAVGIGT